MKEDLKKQLHILIDAINDEPTLSILKEDLAAYALEKNMDGLTPDQVMDLDQAIKEADGEDGLQAWDSLKNELNGKWREG